MASYSTAWREIDEEGALSSTATLPPTSLIICSRNRPKLLFESVASVLRGRATPTEILIMDQSDEPHPTLSTLGSVRGCDVRYVRTRARGESPAKNEAMAIARYPILVFTDDDVLVTPDWFATLVAALLDAGPRSVVMGQVPPLNEGNADGFAPTKKLGDTPEVYEGRVGVDVLCPINMAMYRSVFDEVGGFDERLGAGAPFAGAEDNDFGFRALEAGYRIVYEPRAVVYHRAWRRERDYLRVRWTYAQGQGAFYAKHLSLHDRYILRRLVREVTRRVERIAQRIRWLDRRKALGDTVYILGLLYGTTQWLLTQTKAR
ncbi:MAG: glycosyltransferase [Anaerolineae bacterium]